MPNQINKYTVNEVCIYDFALKKRDRYGTIMIDIHTHRIIDMIESRDKEDVVAWLKLFPNLTAIYRDGSLVYNDAIKLAHSSAVQVSDSDRVHLLKNFTDYCCEIIKPIMKNVVEIPCNNCIDIVTLRKKYKFHTK